MGGIESSKQTAIANTVTTALHLLLSDSSTPVLFDQALAWRSLSEAAACLQSRRGDRKFWKRLRVILLGYNDGGADNLMVGPYRT